MDLFKNNIQPTIVHIGEAENLPIQNKYLLNYNVVQIDWYNNNSILMEDGSGIIVLEDTNNDNPLSSLTQDYMDLMSDGIMNKQNALDIPRIFFTIDDKFLNSNGEINAEIQTPNVIISFITTLLSLSDNCIEHPDSNSFMLDYILRGELFDGITIKPGVDYFINQAFNDYLVDTELSYANVDDNIIKGIIEQLNSITLPNYLDVNANIQLPWIPLTISEQNNTDLEFYYDINELIGFENEYNVDNFYSSFCSIILDNTTLNIVGTDINNLRYKYVLEYFRNNKSDEASKAIQLILGTTYTNTAKNTNLNSVNLCNCGFTNSGSISTCSSLYSDAMLEYLKDMLGNADFYNDWFYIVNNKSKTPNSDMIKKLKLLIKSFIDKGYNLSFSEYNKYNCNCPDNAADEISKSNYNIINKYNNVLNWVDRCLIRYNINKIKIYGSQFAELLPNLQF